MRYLLNGFLVIAILVDLTFSFKQHLSMPHDGDLNGGVLPEESVTGVLADPFGFEVFSTGEKHANPNRYFCHWFLYTYYNNAPLVLQRFFDPIDSLYYSTALLKITVQITLLLCLIFLSTGNYIPNTKGLIAGAIGTFLFVVDDHMTGNGILLKDTTYFVFYSLPFAALVIYFLPLFMRLIYGRKHPVWLLIGFALFSPVVALSGILSAPIIALIGVGSLIYCIHRVHFFRESWKATLNYEILIILVPALVLGAYSIVLGQFDAIADDYHLSIADRYARFFSAIIPSFLAQRGIYLPLIFVGGFYAFNSAAIRSSWKATTLLLFFLSCLYLLLLPLGGYRPWRPDIIRVDVAIPVVYLIMVSMVSLALRTHTIKSPLFRGVVIFLIVNTCFYLNKYDPYYPEYNSCEKRNLQLLSSSTKTPVLLENDCNFFQWQQVHEPENSAPVVEMLARWNICEPEVRFYQKNP